MRLELGMGAGSQHSGVLTLTNNSAGKTRVRTELLDFHIDDQATPQFEREDKGEAAYTCRPWLSVNPMETELQPSSQMQVRYTVRVPEGVPEGSYHCAVGFTTLPAADQMGATGMRMAVRVVAAFYVNIGTPKIKGGLKEFKLERTNDGTAAWNAIVVLSNDGSYYYRPTGTLDVIDAEGNILEVDDFQSLPVLPNREQRFVFRLKTPLQNGKYTLRARVDIGTGEIQEGRAAVSTDVVKPGKN